MRSLKWFLCTLFLIIAGCAFVKVPLFHPDQRLQEQVVEGKGKAKILLMDISGVISDKKKTGGLGLSQQASLVDRIREELQKAEKDRAVGGVILKINSPGGTVSATDTIHHEITRFKRRTGVRVIACVTGLAASGGYYIAAAADEIVAQPTSITGSIGVIVMKLNVDELFSKIGIQEETIKSAEKKDLWSPFRPTTPEENMIMHKIIDTLHERFVKVVLTGREPLLNEAEVKKLADGRIFTADQAAAVKLVDKVGYLDDAVREMKVFLNVDEATVITYCRPGTYKGTIYSGRPGDSGNEINLIAINGDALSLGSGVQFMYLWKP